MRRIWQKPGRTNLRTFAPLQSPGCACEKLLQALSQRRQLNLIQSLYKTNTDSVLRILVKSLFKRFAVSSAIAYIRGCAQLTRAGRVLWEALWTPAMSL